MSSPGEVRDEERIARFCDRTQVRNNGVRYHAFVMTRFPTELSVDRIEYCDAPARAVRESAERGHTRTFIILVAGEVRALERIFVHAKPMKCPPDERDAPEHAEIHIVHDVAPELLQSKTDMQSLADVWAKHIDHCTKLADIARARDCDKPQAN